MNKSFAGVLSLVLVFLLSACSATQSKSYQEEVPPRVISTEFLLPKEIDPHHKTTLKIKLAQGSKALKSADQAVFAISKAASGEQIGEIAAKHEGKGIYSAETIFHENGVYDIQVHAKAGDMRVMPIKRVIVGDVSHQEIESLDGHKKDDESGREHHH
ncbi:FixH family protein [Bacillus swezeyi]|uniref:FixH family protein n=1 Tax=Bacillus swezeyi TaxID=1925020 RepID=UPI0027DD8311|nr:FixH family protein [Bacillus swezeyi]